MTDVTRAEELVQMIEQDDAFRAAVEAVPTVSAKRAVLDAHGFQDVGLDDMRVYVESKGRKLVLRQGGHELSEEELAAVAGGLEGIVQVDVGYVLDLSTGMVRPITTHEQGALQLERSVSMAAAAS